MEAVATVCLAALKPGTRPFHVHVSEQPAENADCRARYGCSPTGLLDRHGLLGPTTTVVHGTHATGEDVRRLGATGTVLFAIAYRAI